jgi:D-threonate/D-erythronate kinase
MSIPEASVPSPRFGLIADDLTGACDATVQFAARGFSTVVCIDSPPGGFGAWDLVALNTSSRNDSSALAAQKVRAACGEMRNERREIIFKKIDSTLRGNLNSEIAATMEICGFTTALVAPAYPAMGRIVENGTLRVAGPAGQSLMNLAEVLQEQGARRVVTVGHEEVARGPEALCQQLKTLPDGTIAALDSIRDADLETIAHAGLQTGGRALLVGSAGLAAATAKILSKKFDVTPSQPRAPSEKETLPRSSIFLMGSTHPVTQAQMDFLVRHGKAIRIGPESIARQEASETLKSGRPLLISVEPRHGDNLRLKEFLSVLNTDVIRGMTLSGGDTALAILRALGAKGIKIEREVLPGIPFGQVMGGEAEGLVVVTKAGGFGKEDALVKVAEFFESQKRTA